MAKRLIYGHDPHTLKSFSNKNTDYYAFKANPNTYKLDDALTHYTGIRAEVKWTVCKNAEPGGTLLICKSGSKAGIYAKATIISKPKLGTPDDEYWINKEDAKKLRWMAKITALDDLSARPILEKRLIAIPELDKFAAWLHSQGTTRYLLGAEAAAIDAIV